MIVFFSLNSSTSCYYISKSSRFWFMSVCLRHQIFFSFKIFSGKYTPQYEWLEEEFTKVNRKETPWLIVMMHSPWYNSYNYHYMEGETMRVMYEQWFVQYKVDLVFAGHVHAYERSVSFYFNFQGSYSHRDLFIQYFANK
jgi:Calcineurin-like phosphoesterase